MMDKAIKQKGKMSNDARLELSWERIQASSLRYGKVDPLTAQTFLNFIYTHDQVASHFAVIARAHGITRAGINVLTILRSSEGKGCHQQTLSQLLLVSRANVTGLVDGLIRKGLAQRLPDESDRRACIVKISSEGEQLLDSILPQYHTQIAKIYSGLNKKEKEFFNQIMDKLRVSIGALKNQESS